MQTLPLRFFSCVHLKAYLHRPQSLQNSRSYRLLQQRQRHTAHYFTFPLRLFPTWLLNHSNFSLISRHLFSLLQVNSNKLDSALRFRFQVPAHWHMPSHFERSANLVCRISREQSRPPFPLNCYSIDTFDDMGSESEARILPTKQLCVPVSLSRPKLG